MTAVPIDKSVTTALSQPKNETQPPHVPKGRTPSQASRVAPLFSSGFVLDFQRLECVADGAGALPSPPRPAQLIYCAYRRPDAQNTICAVVILPRPPHLTCLTPAGRFSDLGGPAATSRCACLDIRSRTADRAVAASPTARRDRLTAWALLRRLRRRGCISHLPSVRAQVHLAGWTTHFLKPYNTERVPLLGRPDAV